MGEIQAAIEFGSDPDLSGLVTAMIGLILGCMIRIPPNVFEKRRDSLEKIFLVVFGGKW